MGSPLPARCVRNVVMPMFVSLAAFACSAPDPTNQPSAANVSGAVGHAGSAPGAGGVSSSGAGGLGAGGVGTGGIGIAGGAFAGSAGNTGTAGRGNGGGGGALTAGSHSGGTSGGGSTGGGGGSMTDAACEMIKSEYAAALEQQLACRPNAGSQCTNRAAAVPGCECLVFIQPKDPFAIEHLSNLADGWFSADCSTPSCPAKCSTAAAGTCQADAKSPLGGRCLSP